LNEKSENEEADRMHWFSKGKNLEMKMVYVDLKRDERDIRYPKGRSQ